MLIALLRTYSWQELRHHPWRSAAAVCAVMLGVALGFAVHTINHSALDEFAQAVRSVNGQPDLEVRAAQGFLPEALYAQVAALPGIELASPWLELSVQAQAAPSTSGAPVAAPIALRLIGIDPLLIARVAPNLMPRNDPGADRLAMLAPDTVFLNAAATQALQGVAGLPHAPDSPAPRYLLQSGWESHTVRHAGTVAASGPPLAVMDIAAVQDLWERGGQLSRIDVRLRPGMLREQVQHSLHALPQWPAGAVVSAPDDATQRVSNLSRAYRVNLTVLAMVALFTGAFLVFSVLALSVAQRAAQFALLAVLGATPRERLALVLAESALLGTLGSVLGIALGSAMAQAALQWLGGDLGGGYFAGVRPALQWSTPAALVYGALGIAAAVAGGWGPARSAQALPPAQTLKGLGTARSAARGGIRGVLLLVGGVLLAQLPPLGGVPLAAYASIGMLLIGGIVLLPWLLQGLLQWVLPVGQRHALSLLALERARRTPGSAAIAVGGVVASLSLAVALTVMVTSFRGSVTQWLDAVLPAPLYVRSALGNSGSDATLLPAAFAQAAAALPGVERAEPMRASPLQLQATQAPLTILSRPLGPDAARSLPLVGDVLAVPAGRTAVYVSEAVVDLYGVRPGSDWPALTEAFALPAQTQAPAERSAVAPFFVAGVWRDYARQSGTVAMDRAVWLQLTGDARTSDVALWPRPGTEPQTLQPLLQALAQQLATQANHPHGMPDSAATATATAADAPPLLAFSSSAALRERSLGIFDRSFAVTYWLQAVAIVIGLFGVAASFSAQVLARRKEFGLLTHLGFTRRQVLTVVAAEGAVWTAIGAVAGVALGLAVAVVLVHVVNPQSFHWTMDLAVPGARLLALCMAVVVSGTLTAWLAGRAAAGRDAVLAVKEDW